MKASSLLVAAALFAPAAPRAQDADLAPESRDAGRPDGRDGGRAQGTDGGPAGAADAGAPLNPAEKAAAQATDQAKKDVDVAGIHLQVAKLYLAGLYGLAGAPTTWDREHGVALFTSAQNAVSDAERQLAELQGLAQRNWPGARDALTRARNTLVRAQGQLRSLSVPLRTGGGQDQAGQSVIGQVYKALDASKNELESAAKAMGVDTKLRTP
jgi:hypothetical protein